MDTKVTWFLLTVLVALLSWLGRGQYEAIKIMDSRLAIVEATLITKAEAKSRLDLLEFRVATLEGSL